MNKKLKQKLRKIFIKYDPMKIYLGTNLDEYDPEINLLQQGFHRGKTFQEFLIEVHSVFIIMFDKKIVGSKSKYKTLAKEVYDCLSHQL